MAALPNPIDVVRQLGGIVTDLHTITRSTTEMAERLRMLPALHDRLAEIETRVEAMRADVERMRQGVDVLGGQVDDLRGELEPIGRLAGRVPGRRRPRVDGVGP